ncbi:putative reverse transcriptase domain-containing protein, partial [Tanacetum coccineum]
STGLFLFQFSYMDGLDAMLENEDLKKDVGNVPTWVKLHGVPVTASSEDGLSVIATKLGTPLMLDSFTCDMCMQSWGGAGQAMLEQLSLLKDTIVKRRKEARSDYGDWFHHHL